MPCTDKSGNQWSTNTTICEDGVQKVCCSDGTWIVDGLPCDGSEANAARAAIAKAPGAAKAGGA